VCALTCWHTTVGVWIPGFPSAPLAFTPAERHRGQTATSHVSSQAHHGAIRTGDSSKPRHWGHAGNARKPQGTGARPCRVAGNARKPRHRAMGGGHERTPIQMKSACSVISIWLRYCREKAEKRACAATGLTDDWVPSVAAGDAAHQSDELLAALLAHPVPTMQRTLYTLPTRALRCCPLFNLSASLLDSVLFGAAMLGFLCLTASSALLSPSLLRVIGQGPAQRAVVARATTPRALPTWFDSDWVDERLEAFAPLVGKEGLTESKRLRRSLRPSSMGWLAFR